MRYGRLQPECGSPGSTIHPIATHLISFRRVAGLGVLVSCIHMGFKFCVSLDHAFCCCGDRNGGVENVYCVRALPVRHLTRSGGSLFPYFWQWCICMHRGSPRAFWVRSCVPPVWLIRAFLTLFLDFRPIRSAWQTVMFSYVLLSHGVCVPW